MEIDDGERLDAFDQIYRRAALKRKHPYQHKKQHNNKHTSSARSLFAPCQEAVLYHTWVRCWSRREAGRSHHLYVHTRHSSTYVRRFFFMDINTTCRQFQAGVVITFGTTYCCAVVGIGAVCDRGGSVTHRRETATLQAVGARSTHFICSQV